MSAPRSDFMAQSLVLSLDVCPGLGISPLRTNIWLSFSQADLGPNKHLAEFFSGRSWPKIGPGIIFFGFFEKFETFFSKICAHSERYRNLLAGIFEILTFSRFHCHRSCRGLSRLAESTYESGQRVLPEERSSSSLG